MKYLLVTWLWCAHSECDHRPSIREAIQVLNFEAPLHLLQLYSPRSSYHTPTMNEATSLLSTANFAADSKRWQNPFSGYSYNTNSSWFKPFYAASPQHCFSCYNLILFCLSIHKSKSLCIKWVWNKCEELIEVM